MEDVMLGVEAVVVGSVGVVAVVAGVGVVDDEEAVPVFGVCGF